MEVCECFPYKKLETFDFVVPRVIESVSHVPRPSRAQSKSAEKRDVA